MRLAALRASVALLGYRGCGKTTAGRLVASRLGRVFIDTDERVAAHAGCTIREIFERWGEAHFRALEHDALRTALASAPCVLSVGGGAVLRADNRELLRRCAVRAWLAASAETLHARISADAASAAQRPALRGGGLPEVQRLLAERTPLYASLATVVVSTEGRSIDSVVDELIAALGDNG